MTTPTPATADQHAAALKRTARRCWIFGTPLLLLGAAAAIVRVWLGVSGLTPSVVLGVAILVVLLGLALLGLGLVCSVILLQARMKQRSDQRALRRAAKREQRADAKRAKQSQAAVAPAERPAAQPEAPGPNPVTMATPPVPPSVQTQAGSPQSSDRPPLIF
ncbi:MAG: hypothetical protein ACRDG3_06690 [Tepidiformaceae bacterium]